jgi:hypothetical protein
MERCGRCRKVGAIGRREKRFDEPQNFSGEMVVLVLEHYHHECHRDRDLSFARVGLYPDSDLYPALDVSRGHGLSTIGINSRIVDVVALLLLLLDMTGKVLAGAATRAPFS